MNDIIEQLKEMISVEADGSPKTPILQAAVAEIEQLRAVAGAVSAGPTHRQIRASASEATRIDDPDLDDHVKKSGKKPGHSK